MYFMTFSPSLLRLAVPPPFLWAVSMVPFLSDFHTHHVPSSVSVSSSRHGQSMNANHLIVLTVQKGRADPPVLTASHFTTIVVLNASSCYSLNSEIAVKLLQYSKQQHDILGKFTCSLS